MLTELAGHGLGFDYLALDCGWNDPSDLQSFHPLNFPNGPASVLNLVRQPGPSLMLWGDLRPMLDDPDRLRQVTDLLSGTAVGLAGDADPVGSVAADLAAYGYVHRSPGTASITLSSPLMTTDTLVPWSELGVKPTTQTCIRYLTRGAQATVVTSAEGVIISQSGGSIVSADVGGAATATATSQPAAAPVVRAGAAEVALLASGSSATVPVERLVQAYIGRVPRLAGLVISGDPESSARRLAEQMPPRDRVYVCRDQRWSIDIAADRATEVGLFVRLLRDGTAWHHDALDDLVESRFELDGRAVETTVFPDFTHQQAGSWSWLRLTTQLTPGQHRGLLSLRILCPNDVDSEVSAWLR